MIRNCTKVTFCTGRGIALINLKILVLPDHTQVAGAVFIMSMIMPIGISHAIRHCAFNYFLKRWIIYCRTASNIPGIHTTIRHYHKKYECTHLIFRTRTSSDYIFRTWSKEYLFEINSTYMWEMKIRRIKKAIFYQHNNGIIFGWSQSNDVVGIYLCRPSAENSV